MPVILELKFNDKPLKDQKITLSISSNKGNPGKLTKYSGQTNESGIVELGYTFPKFTSDQVDTIRYDCEVCQEELDVLTVKMAPTVVGFFNGVWNTELQARPSTSELKKGVDSSKGAAVVKYETLYNQTGCGQQGRTCFEDIAKVFIMRRNELDGVLANRFDVFWELLQGKQADSSSLIGGSIKSLGKLGATYAKLIDDIFNATLNQVAAGWALMASDPQTPRITEQHSARLSEYASKDYSILLIAHSQGNLFANLAFDPVKSKYPEVAMKTLHIAPASSTLRGEYILGDKDLVINGLRITGANSVPTANISVPFTTGDASGHTLAGVYLNPAFNALKAIKNMIASAMNNLVPA